MSHDTSSVVPAPRTLMRSADAMRAMERTNRRVLGAIFAVVFAAVLGVAVWLSPDPAGHGTHTQLGFAPCAWMENYNTPCPTCGMTTAFSHAAHLHPVRAFLTQPAGFVLAVFTATAFWASALTAIFGWNLPMVFPWFFRLRMVVVGLVLIGLGWVYTLLTW